MATLTPRRVPPERHDESPRQTASPWALLLVGPLAGAALGAVARGWMRLITDDPEFSWNGTVFIVLAFTLAGAGHGLASAVRRAGARRRWTTIARTLAVVLTLPIFTGAGMVMLPTVVGGSLARARTDWPRAARAATALLAVPVPVILAVELAGDGLTARRLLGAVLLAATYAVVVGGVRSTLAPVADGWRMRRAVRITVALATVVLLVLVAMSAVGVATADL